MPVNEISFDPLFKLNYLLRDSERNILLKINNYYYTPHLMQMGEKASVVEYVFPGGYSDNDIWLLICLFKFILT